MYDKIKNLLIPNISQPIHGFQIILYNHLKNNVICVLCIFNGSRMAII